jgi:thiol-disulfide isomerase/thioredoxin
VKTNLRARRRLLIGVISMALLAVASCAGAAPATGVRSAPAFTHSRAEDWLNSPPLTLEALRGHVVIVDVWTFDCWNCYRSLPWLHGVEQQFSANGLRVIGVHTPELPQEYVRANVVRKLTELHIDYPVMLDNDYSYWKALGNQYWPAFYLIDKHGQIRGLFVGETHQGDSNAAAIESAIQKLNAEP